MYRYVAAALCMQPDKTGIRHAAMNSNDKTGDFELFLCHGTVLTLLLRHKLLINLQYDIK